MKGMIKSIFLSVLLGGMLLASPGKLKQFGTDYGGFSYPENLPGLNEDSIIYCVGVGQDISHDIEVARVTKARIYLIDPTPMSLDHVNLVKGVIDGVRSVDEYVVSDKWKSVHGKKDRLDILTKYNHMFKGYWQIVRNGWVDTNKLIYLPYGLDTHNKKRAKFFYTYPEGCSLTQNMIPSDDFFEVDVKKLSTIMTELGHSKIDLLKIDIEGVENEVLNQMLDEKIYPTYLSVDFDTGWYAQVCDRPKCMRTIRRLKKHGYRVLHSACSDYSFVRKKNLR